MESRPQQHDQSDMFTEEIQKNGDYTLDIRNDAPFTILLQWVPDGAVSFTLKQGLFNFQVTSEIWTLRRSPGNGIVEYAAYSIIQGTGD